MNQEENNGVGVGGLALLALIGGAFYGMMKLLNKINKESENESEEKSFRWTDANRWE